MHKYFINFQFVDEIESREKKNAFFLNYLRENVDDFRIITETSCFIKTEYVIEDLSKNILNLNSMRNDTIQFPLEHDDFIQLIEIRENTIVQRGQITQFRFDSIDNFF